MVSKGVVYNHSVIVNTENVLTPHMVHFWIGIADQAAKLSLGYINKNDPFFVNSLDRTGIHFSNLRQKLVNFVSIVRVVIFEQLVGIHCCNVS